MLRGRRRIQHMTMWEREKMTSPRPASPLYWRLSPTVYHLLGSKCSDCGHITYPQTKVCHKCSSFNQKDYQLPKTGKVHTFCINWTPPPGLEPPTVNVIVDLDGGGRYVGLITEVSNPEEVKIGTKVEMVFRKIVNDSGLDVYGYKFRLVEEA
jgi:uncharacterized OB-fold protein